MVKKGDSKGKRYKWTIQHTGIFLLAAVLVVSLGAALAAPVSDMVAKISTQQQEQETTPPLMPQQIAAAGKQQAQQQWKAQLEERAALVEIPEALGGGISLLSADEPQEDQCIKGYQRICADKALSAAEREILTELILAYPQQTETLYVLYDFLYDCFFTKQDLQTAMQRCQAGEPVETVLETYFSIEQSYQPPQVEGERVYYYIDDRGLTPDDSAIAKILMFRQISDYEAIMGRLAEGETWEQVGSGLGLLNFSGKMRTVTVTQEEVEQAQETLHISEEEAVSRVAQAKKANVPEEALTDYLTGNKSSGAALKQRSLDVYQSSEGRE